jgi:ferredoxin
MSVLINFKICDNAKECGGIEVCPTGALSWDEENETIKIDNDKCIACGACESNCPIGAISVAQTKEEYNKKKEEIDKDPRTVKDLFVDRYGAVSISEFFQIELDEMGNKISKEGITLIELYNPDVAECLLKSIPIKDITKDMPSNTTFYKIAVEDDAKEQFNLEELPALLIYKDNKLLGTIDGYYNTDNKEEFLNKINEILGE